MVPSGPADHDAGEVGPKAAAEVVRDTSRVLPRVHLRPESTHNLDIILFGDYFLVGMFEVIATDEFTEWYSDLEDAVAEDVTEAVDLLGRMGTALGYPHSSAIRGVKAPLRELRIQSKGKPLRVF